MGLFSIRERRAHIASESGEAGPAPAPVIARRVQIVTPRSLNAPKSTRCRDERRSPLTPKSTRGERTLSLSQFGTTPPPPPFPRKEGTPVRQHAGPAIKRKPTHEEYEGAKEDDRSECSSTAPSAIDSALHLTTKSDSSAGSRPSPGQAPAQPTAATKAVKAESALAALQIEGPDVGDAHLVDPVTADDPRSWDLVPPPPPMGKEDAGHGYNLEKRAQLLLSRRHLEVVVSDPKLLCKFVSFIHTYRPASVDRLTCYRQAKKALQAIRYSNAIVKCLEPVQGHAFTAQEIAATRLPELEKLMEQTFDELVRHDFPAYVCSVWIPLVAATVHQRINGALPERLVQASEGLAEVFCLTDPRQKNDPIVLASREFTTTTQYGLNFVCGQNCRFLQGANTDSQAVQRVRDALAAKREHSEVLLNYRRDGSPFMNLCMLVPLTDFDGNLKYFLGAQVDVSGLLKSCAGFESLALTVKQVEERGEGQSNGEVESLTESSRSGSGDFHLLSEMLDDAELATVRQHGGAMHRIDAGSGDVEDENTSDQVSMVSSYASNRPRMLLVDPDDQAWTTEPVDGQGRGRGRTKRNATPGREAADNTKFMRSRQLETMYKDFLLVRPAPDFSITFTSSSLRERGLMQTDFFVHVDGSTRVRDGLHAAMAEGHKVTAKVRWPVSMNAGSVGMAARAAQDDARNDQEMRGDGGRMDVGTEMKWIHCTPLVGADERIGVWVVMLIADASDG